MTKFALDSANVTGLLAPAADAAGRTSSKYASLKNAHGLSIMCYVNQGNAATVKFTPLQATKADGTGSKGLSANATIYVNLDESAGNVWTRVTDGKDYTTDAATKVKWVRFDIDPDALDLANNFDCVGCSTGASNASNITSVFAVLGPVRYAGATNVNALAD